LAASVAERGAQDDLPVTVREAIAARIDALPANARAALLAAAVVGRTFWRDVVRAVDPVDELDGAFATLESRDFVRRDPSSARAVAIATRGCPRRADRVRTCGGGARRARAVARGTTETRRTDRARPRIRLDGT